MLAQGLELFRSQGPVFWGAAAAVALGATLLLMTVFAFLRQAWRRGAGRRRLRRRTTVAGRAGTLTVDDTGYRFAAAAAAPAEKPARGPEPYHDQLWVRLKQAGDRLEACHESLGGLGASAWESPLKGGASAVEYVFRKGIG